MLFRKCSGLLPRAINLRQSLVQMCAMSAVIEYGVVRQNVLLDSDARRALAIFKIGDGFHDHLFVSRMFRLCFRRHVVRL